MPEELHQTTWCIEKTCNFIRESASDGSPWLFSVNMFDPHHNFDPPPIRLERYMSMLDDIPLPSYTEGELEQKTPYQRADHLGAYGARGWLAPPTMTASDHRLIRAAYWAMCDLIDAQIGRLLDVLKETNQLKNTLLVFMSDHGEMLGDHGIYLKGPYFYEPAIHVPLIISWPGRVPARRVSSLVELVDLAPTLLEASGLEPHAGMQGKSLWPLLSGQAEADNHHDDIYCEYYNAMPFYKEGSAPYLTMVRTDHHKLVADHSNHGGELYDLTDDPQETCNLWDDTAVRSIKTDMLLRLCNRMAWTVDPLPRRCADW
jgi:arylsulfatase A-like enzyme